MKRSWFPFIRRRSFSPTFLPETALNNGPSTGTATPVPLSDLSIRSENIPVAKILLHHLETVRFLAVPPISVLIWPSCAPQSPLSHPQFYVCSGVPPLTHPPALSLRAMPVASSAPSAPLQNPEIAPDLSPGPPPSSVGIVSIGTSSAPASANRTEPRRWKNSPWIAF